MSGPRALLLAAVLLAPSGCELLIRPDEVPPPKPACVPKTCEDWNKNCGSIDDGCGTSIGCGECTAPEVCGGAGEANVCGACQPRCQGRECGPDGCGGKCGTCGPQEVCDSQAGQCVGCRSDADCTASPAGRRCELTRKICVACLADADCDPSGLVKCDTASFLCQASCKTDADCTGVGAPRCDPSTRQCVGCLAEADCQSPKPHCLASTKTCVACRDGGDCASPTAQCRSHDACVQCLGDPDCPGGRCEPLGGACVGCLSDADCQGTTPRCGPDRRCVQCTAGTDCSSGTCKADNTCQPPGVPGDTCALPIVVSPSAGQATLTGDTTSFTDDTHTVGCGGGGPDVVYQLVLASPQDVDVIVWPEVSGYRAAVALRKACADETKANEVSCGKSRANGEPATASAKNLPAGTYYVLVDGYITSKGAYSLTILTRTPGGVAPDSCAKASPLAFDASGWAWAVGDTSGLTDDRQSADCGGDGEPDLAYKLTLTQPRSLDAIVSATDVNISFAPVLALTDGCSLPTELVCNEAVAGPGATRIQYPKLAAGTYILWVDGNYSSSGPFALWAGLDLPLNDLCEDAYDLTFDSAGKAHVSGSTLIAGNEAASQGCMGSGGDVFYRITVGAGTTLTATVTPSASSVDYDPVVYLRTVCDTKTSEVGCVHGPGKTLTASGLGAGTYYLVVDGYLGTTGEFTLDVTRTP